MAKEEKKKSNARVFKRTTEKIHDLYKLEVAKVKLNQAWDGTVDYREAEHVHFFHTIDSKGIAQNTSHAVAGHFHVLEVVEPATDHSPAVLKCSPPLQYVRKKGKYGQWEKVLASANPDDTHTHDVTYLDSHKFTPAKINPEFVKFQAAEASKIPATSGGIVEQ